jgi:pilus assembly protein CpaD
MTKKIAFLGFAALAVTGCTNVVYEERDPAAGLSAVNVPVVSQTNYAYDVAAPGGVVPPAEAARLSAWFDSLGLRYGDVIYVDGPMADSARQDVANVAGRYGLMLADGAPVTAGAVAPGSVRVVVGRSTASVPNCPNWGDSPLSPNPQNTQLPNYGCAVNGAMAQMIANPNDLIYGREGSGVTDTQTAARAVQSYREAAPSGTEGLEEVSTGGK